MALQEMKNMDIHDVEIDSLVEGASVSVDLDLPIPQRMEDVLQQMNGNPYFFKSGRLLVKVDYSDTPISFNERMEDYLRTI